MLKFDPWTWSHAWSQDLHLNKSEYALLGHHVCKILNLWLLQFYRRRFLKRNMHFGLCWNLMNKSESTPLGHHVCKILNRWHSQFYRRRFLKLNMHFGLHWNLTPGCGLHVWPQGLYLNKSEYTTLGHHVCKILNLWLLQFYRRTFLKLNMHFSLCWNLTPVCGPTSDPRALIWTSLNIHH